MSVLGQEQTYAVQKGMSALPPKADITRIVSCGASLPVSGAAGLLGFQIEGPAVWVGRGQPVLLTVRV